MSSASGKFMQSMARQNHVSGKVVMSMHQNDSSEHSINQPV
jgi:hypothetical protein